MPSSSKSKKRSAFDSVADLELEDQAAAKLRKKQSIKDVAKAKAARSQTKVFGKLMETRILMQRSLATEGEASDCVQECDQLLEQLLRARRQLMNWTVEEETDDNDNSPEEEYSRCQQEWKDVLNRRHQDLRLHAGLASKTQFKVLDSSFWTQVESTVAHVKTRKRTSGEDENEFQDAKVYQQMLKDFLTSASHSSNDNNATSTVVAQSKRTKNKVDRKASKGRKIRYVEIPKLVNFTFPVSRAQTTNLNEDEWFQSLFGGKHQSNNNRAKPMAITDGEEEEDY